ncbi:hypothetical protein NE236_33600 [Actinoallomurus purpureus]|uniref:hypothetical protein n=1 Tax=Actinoallomurus purpureus TaxID=478114 RepID=UPI00209263AA|nr:hypothetical protein [Actinoallomurus purpureus]MCO6009919.1 hypothetical protein [Actinoallomurus purpureus]
MATAAPVHSGMKTAVRASSSFLLRDRNFGFYSHPAIRIGDLARCTIIAALALLMTACGPFSGSAGHPRDEAIDWKVPSTPDPGARQEFVGLYRGQDVTARAEQELISRCMTTRGYHYIPFVNAAHTVEWPGFNPISPSRARSDGYNIRRLVDTAPDLNEKLLQTMSSGEQKKWNTALGGDENGLKIEVPVPEVGVAMMAADGCVTTGRKQLYGNLRRWLKNSYFADNFPDLVTRRMASDPLVRTLDAPWSNCMKSLGFSNVSSPIQAREAAEAFYGKLDSRKAFGEEKRLASADATCEERGGYATRRQILEDRYLTAGLHAYATLLGDIRRMNDTALTSARRVLSGGR